jgi:hypothetical protein
MTTDIGQCRLKQPRPKSPCDDPSPRELTLRLCHHNVHGAELASPSRVASIRLHSTVASPNATMATVTANDVCVHIHFHQPWTLPNEYHVVHGGSNLSFKSSYGVPLFAEPPLALPSAVRAADPPRSTSSAR